MAAATSPAQAEAWLAMAMYMDARIQTDEKQFPGRKPDMSVEAGAAFRAVLREVSRGEYPSKEFPPLEYGQRPKGTPHTHFSKEQLASMGFDADGERLGSKTFSDGQVIDPEREQVRAAAGLEITDQVDESPEAAHKEDLYRLAYVSALSTRSPAVADMQIKQIMAAANKNNPAMGIGGRLFYHTGKYELLQVLEGEEEKVRSLFTTITCDNRHVGCDVLWTEKVFDERRFTTFGMQMGRVDVTRDQFVKYAQTGQLELNADAPIVSKQSRKKSKGDKKKKIAFKASIREGPHEQDPVPDWLQVLKDESVHNRNALAHLSTPSTGAAFAGGEQSFNESDAGSSISFDDEDSSQLEYVPNYSQSPSIVVREAAIVTNTEEQDNFFVSWLRRIGEPGTPGNGGTDANLRI